MARSKANKLSKTQYLTIISLVVIIFSLPFLIPLFKLVLSLQSSADPNIVPNEVIVSNITSTSAVISWYTNSETEGFIKYGTASDALNFLGNDIRDVGNTDMGKYKTHIIKINNLSPDTEYFYEIFSNGEKYNSEETLHFKTFIISESVDLPNTLKGQLNKEIANALVYVFASNDRSTSEIRSTYTASNGTFTYDISGLKTADGTSEFPLENAKLVTYVNAVDEGRARIIHNTDEDPGDITLDPNSDISFSLDVDITSGQEQETPPQSNPPQQNTQPPQQSEPKEKVYGIDIMKNIYSSSSSSSNPTIPTNIFVSNISQTSFTVNWVTKQATSGYVIYGASRYNLSNKVLDNRGGDMNTKRFTHSVSITDPARNAGDTIYFKIVSNGKYFGKNNTTTAYSFVAPESLSTPPSPKSLLGELNLLPSSRLSASSRDYLIYGKVHDSSGNSSVYISSVPAYNSTGWTLSVGDALSEDLKSNIEFSSMDVSVYGEYNSYSSQTVSNINNSVSVDLVPGLTVLTPEHNQTYSSLGKMEGTANPNSNVNISLNNSSFSTTADSTGDWSIPVSSMPYGKYTLKATANSSVLGLSFFLRGNLPNTALPQDWIPIFIGMLLFALGIYITVYVRKNKLRR